MSLRTKINGFTAWVNLRLTPYNQLLNNVLMDLLSGTHMKFFVESFTGRDLKRLENLDGLSQQQMETRVGWVIEELKKCSILPDDVYVDSRLFAMRSADHVFDLLWRLISHDIWFVWERVEYLQVDDMDVLTQVPFKWTPDPPPKKKKSKKAGKKSLLTGFGPGAAHEDKSEDDISASDKHDCNTEFGSQASGINDIPDIYLEDYQTYNDEDDKYLTELYMGRDLRADSRYTDKMSDVFDSRGSNYSPYVPNDGQSSYVYGGPDSRLLESADLPMFESQNTNIYGFKSSAHYSRHTDSQRSTRNTGYSRNRKISDLQNMYYDGSRRLIEIHVEPLARGDQEKNRPSRTGSNPVWEGTHFLVANYQAQSRVSSASSLRSTESPIKSAPNLAFKKGHKDNWQANSNIVKIDSTKQLNRSKKKLEKRELTSSTLSEFNRANTTRVVSENSSVHRSKCGTELAESSLGGSKTEMKKLKRKSLTLSESSAVRIVKAIGTCDNKGCRLCGIARLDQDDMEEAWVKFPNTEYVKHFKKKKRDKEDYPSPDECVLEMVNYQLKTTRDGKGLFCYSIDDFVDSRVLCALVNSFVPNTFTADLLLNDRWTINTALKTAEKMFYAETPFDAEDLVEADPMAVCAYFAFLLMVAYRYRQTTAVVNRVDFINMLIRECNHELEKFPPIIANMQELQRRKDIKQELEKHKQAIENLEKKFDVDFSRKWVQHVEHVQNELRREIREKMRQRFDIVEIPRNITINDFCLAAVINLSLTNGSGFYLTTAKEQLSEGRRLVLRHRETKEFIEDFTNKSKATIKETLNLPDVTSTVIEINPMNYPNYEFYFEAQSRNKQLRTGTMFLYQVFPGNTVTWQRLFIKSAREAEFETVEKMIAFFREHSSFINCKEPKSGNTGLHYAARSGHFDIVRLLLENGANVDLKNNFKCTALNFAIEGLQRKICHYLIEWGCDVLSKNIKGQTILETIKNDDFKQYAMDIYDYYSHIVPRIMNGDMELLDQVLADHISKKREFCCLRSRCINGSTLLHTACYYGHIPAIRELLAQRVDVNLRDYKGATPLHRAKNPDVMQILLEAGAHVNAEDSEGNTPLHVKCYGETNQQSETECIEMLLDRKANLTIRNSRGLLPIHCCAMQGRVDVMKLMMKHDENDTIATSLNKEDGKKPPSLLHLAIANDFIDCAEWLLTNAFHFKEKEPDILMRRILTEQIKLTKRVDALKFLLDNGADPNPGYPGGNTALHYAAGLSGPTDVLELLITYGAEIDAVNEEGCTPLFFATQSNNKFAACVLIEQGSNVRQKNTQALTAFDHIVDFEEWIECGYFTEDIKARLKAYNLKHSRDLIRAISKKVKPPGPLGLRHDMTRSAFTLKTGPGMTPALAGAASAGHHRQRMLPPLKTMEGGGYLMF